MTLYWFNSYIYTFFFLIQIANYCVAEETVQVLPIQDLRLQKWFLTQMWMIWVGQIWWTGYHGDQISCNLHCWVVALSSNVLFSPFVCSPLLLPSLTFSFLVFVCFRLFLPAIINFCFSYCNWIPITLCSIDFINCTSDKLI